MYYLPLMVGLILNGCSSEKSKYTPSAPIPVAGGAGIENAPGATADAETAALEAKAVESKAEFDSLTVRAKVILEQACVSCHNPNNAQGNFGNISQVNEMIASQRMIVPGFPDKSLLITRLAPVSNMPPAGPLPAEDVTTLRNWVARMVVEERKPLNEGEVLSLIRKDIELNVPAAQRSTTRYFTMHVANNRKAPAATLVAMQQGFSKLVNSLSRSPALVQPVAIDAQKLVYRLNLASINMPNSTFDSVINDYYPYSQNFVNVASDPQSAVLAEDHNFVRNALTVNRYLIRLDWFVATAPLPSLYTRLLRLGQNQNDLDFQLGVNVGSNIFNNRVLRAGFKNSNVSSQNRMMERHTQQNGMSYWISYDFASNEGLANIFSVPLGPVGIGQDQRAFVHDGGEIIFQLPNGLFGYYLSDAAGVAIDKGPVSIVKQSDAPPAFVSAIVNGVSCMTCHNQGLIYKKDEIRPFFVANNGNLANGEMNKLLALYPVEATLKAAMDKDNEIYTKALQATGVDPSKPDPINVVYRYYNQPLTKADVRFELGVDEATITRILTQNPYRTRWTSLSQEGGFIKRDEFNIVVRNALEQFKPNVNIIPQILGDMIFTPACMAADPLFTKACLIELVRQEALNEQVATPPP